MLVIGSQALAMSQVLPEGRVVGDFDAISTLEDFNRWVGANKPAIAFCVPKDGSHYHVRFSNGFNYEFEIAWEGSSGADLLDMFNARTGMVYAPASVVLALKLSHRYKKNSPHFLKTMRDIQHLRSSGYIVPEELTGEWMKKREAETYTYNHPKLNQNKQGFFDGDGVPYVYDHDSIHLTQALMSERVELAKGNPTPAYTLYAVEGEEVLSSKEKFFFMPEFVRLYGVYEETCVLALERSQIPYPETPPEQSFKIALMKVCTSITSGWFREYAWETYDKVVALYDELGHNDYLKRFNENQSLLKPYAGV